MTVNGLLQTLLRVNGAIIDTFELDETMHCGGMLPRVRCPEHGVKTAGVPWAPQNSGFTYDFAYSTAWMLRSGVNRTKVSERLRIDWDTVGRLVDLIWDDQPHHAVLLVNRNSMDAESYSKPHETGGGMSLPNHQPPTVMPEEPSLFAPLMVIQDR